MIIDFDWFKAQEVKNFLGTIMSILDIIRIIVPIALIAMTTLDIVKKVINPDEKEGQQKIMIRAISALLVFLSPIIINLVLNFMGIDTSKLGGLKSKFKSEELSPVYVKPEDPVNLSSLLLFNCPSTIKIGDSFEVKTNIPENYEGSIWWEDSKGLLDIIPSSDKKSATVGIYSDSYETTSTLSVHADGLTKSCVINISANFSITNCPPSSKKLKPGDRITLVTDINSKYSGKVLWEQNEYTFNMKTNDDGKSIILEVIDNPPSILSKVTAIKDNKKVNCFINIEKLELDSVSITNCPVASSVFHPGDEIRLYTDIPSDFKGDIEWFPDEENNNFTLIPSSDNRSMTLKVIANPTFSFSRVIVLAGGKASACSIFTSQ